MFWFTVSIFIWLTWCPNTHSHTERSTVPILSILLLDRVSFAHVFKEFPNRDIIKINHVLSRNSLLCPELLRTVKILITWVLSLNIRTATRIKIIMWCLMNDTRIIMLIHNRLLAHAHRIRNPNTHKLLPYLYHHICDFIKIGTRPLLLISLSNFNNLLINLDVHIEQLNDIVNISKTEIVVGNIIFCDILHSFFVTEFKYPRTLSAFIFWHIFKACKHFLFHLIVICLNT